MKRAPFVLGLVLSFGLHVAIAGAEPKAEAEQHFRAGVALQKAEDFHAAIIEYETSLKLYPTKSALFNLANCLKATHKYVEALALFDRLEREYGTALEPAMKSAAQTQREELASLIAWLRVEVDRDGAEVFVDGVSFGKSPLSEPIPLSPGDHEISVHLPGFETAKLKRRFVSEQTVAERIALTPLRPAWTVSPEPPRSEPTATSDEPRAEQGNTGLRTVGYVSAATGAALMTAGAISGIWALAVDSDLSEACRGSSCPVERQSDIDQLNTLTKATNLLLIGGAALTAAGIVMVLVAPKTQTPDKDRRRSATQWDVTWRSGFFGAQVSREF